MTKPNPLTPTEATSPLLALSGIVPVLGRPNSWTPLRQRDFIAHLAGSGCVLAAAASVGMSVSSAYRLRRRPDARGFCAAWNAALAHAQAEQPLPPRRRPAPLPFATGRP